MAIKLITDSACDLPVEYIKENNIGLVTLTVNINGEFFDDDLGQTLKHKDFYNKVREGATPSTAQVNVYTFEEEFRKHIEKGDSILYIGLSSSLSGTYNSANIAKGNILEEYPYADIRVIDSLSVSLGEGSLVYYACEMLKENKSLSEIADWVEDNKRKVIHSIVVDDLNHLKRGGRISGTTAAVGSLLGIKPTLSLDDEGVVVQGEKIKGKKKIIKFLVNEARERAVDSNNQVMFICHADCEEEAIKLKEEISKEVQFKDIIISTIGSVVGSHGGPGTLAAVFMGDKR